MTAQLPPQKQMTGMLGHPVAENPIDRMFDAVYAHDGLHWQCWKCDVAAEDLGAAIARLTREGWIERGGGHRMAAGLSLSREQLEPAMARLGDLLAPGAPSDSDAPRALRVRRMASRQFDTARSAWGSASSLPRSSRTAAS